MTGRAWTSAEIEAVRTRYPNERCEDIARDLGRTPRGVYARANELGVRKSDAFLASGKAGRLDGVRGGATRFAKGHVPANKGLRRPGWAPGRMAETQFPKGVRQGVAVKLYKPIGSERISKDGYLERKVNDDLPLQRRWKAVHRIVWESAHGPIPPGHAVVFKPGRHSIEAGEITVDALELITRAELMKRNSYHNYPQPIPQLIQLRGALNRKINRRSQQA